jgi:hypothetical protein
MNPSPSSSCFSGYSGREYGGQELDESIRPHELMYFRRKYAPIYRRLAAEGHGVLRLKPEDVEYNKKLTEAALVQQKQDEAVKKFVKDETTALEERTRLNLENNYYAPTKDAPTKDDNESSHEESSSTLSNTEHHQKKIKSRSKVPKNLMKKVARIVG